MIPTNNDITQFMGSGIGKPTNYSPFGMQTGQTSQGQMPNMQMPNLQQPQMQMPQMGSIQSTPGGMGQLPSWLQQGSMQSNPLMAQHNTMGANPMMSGIFSTRSPMRM